MPVPFEALLPFGVMMIVSLHWKDTGDIPSDTTCCRCSELQVADFQQSELGTTEASDNDTA